jgi:hypothetical protein
MAIEISVTLSRMARKQCKICKTPLGREVADPMLDDLQEYRVIAAKLTLATGIPFDKNTVWRHRHRCYSLRERAALKKEQLARQRNEPRRLIVEWPAPEHRFLMDGELFDLAQLRENDVLLEIEFENLPAKNPRALAERKEPMNLFEKIKELWNANEPRPLGEPEQPETETAGRITIADPPAAPAACEHKTGLQITPSGKQCRDCGKMLDIVFVPKNAPSRKDLDLPPRFGESRFGRCG